ncbi:MAG: translation initiation factor IF-5A [Methanocorpusculum sp.]|jgi:translation initiation factor 5A|nr:translation initiation factor IF-5A [Methanocorpusculum sp.]MDD3257640.1 translation initiation factor IF-5A [Methanocorpusculum sp.]MDD4133174.1 translation initiation factor IF-5A [Methanocorpusculum sp.]
MKEQTEVGKLKEGRYVVVDDEPCKIQSISISKPGKHGAAKARLDVVGIFDGQKRSVVSPTSSTVYAPIVERKTGQILTIAGNVVTFMDMKDFNNFELVVEDEHVLASFQPAQEVQYIESLGKRKLDL